VPAIVPVFMRGFNNNVNHQRLLEWLLELQPDGFWAAEDETQLAGMVGAVRYGEAAYVNMMVVDPSLQRRGTGKALMEALLAGLDRHGCSTVMLEATEAGVPLYRHFGFEADGATHDVRSTIVREIVTAPARALPSDFEQMVALDAAAFGVTRRRVLEMLLQLPNSRAIISEGGFLIANEFVIGPWVAHSLGAAEALLEEALLLPSTKAGRIMVPAKNSAALNMLLRRGYEINHTAPHMRRGRRLPGRRRELTFGQASFTLG
jgi:hypothetical protein